MTWNHSLKKRDIDDVHHRLIKQLARLRQIVGTLAKLTNEPSADNVANWKLAITNDKKALVRAFDTDDPEERAMHRFCSTDNLFGVKVLIKL